MAKSTPPKVGAEPACAPPGASSQRAVLVTGASGFVGRAVVAELSRRGHRVIATATGTTDLPSAARVEWVVWDAMTTALPPVDFGNVQAVLHLAMPRGVFDFPERAAQVYELAVAATYRLLDSAYRNGVPRVLAASTGDVLGPTGRAVDENDVTYAPSSFYGAAKACAELLLRAYQGKLATGILRFFHPYGPGGDRFLVNRLVRAVVEGQAVTIEGPDGIVLNPVWVEDLAQGACAALEAPHTGIFHFAGPETVTLRELLEIAGALVQRHPVIRASQIEALQRHCGAFERATRLLGYRPQVGVREGLRRVVASFGAPPASG
jgi:UDP-glucose 4-epimerase